jgi:hypothetical protein
MSQEDEDYAVEDLLGDLNKRQDKKKKHSGRKGKRGESNIVKLLTERFQKPFSRVIGSGAHSRRNLSEEAKKILTGDIVAPNDFRFTIESKHGYGEIDLCNVFEGGHRLIDEFMEQAQRDADHLHRKPMLCWKKDRMPILAFLKQEDLPDFRDFKMHLCYNAWVAVSLSELLKKDNTFFFEAA